jgi:hypothetical protein
MFFYPINKKNVIIKKGLLYKSKMIKNTFFWRGIFRKKQVKEIKDSLFNYKQTFVRLLIDLLLWSVPDDNNIIVRG